MEYISHLPYRTNIEKRTVNNRSFRKILNTTPQQQLVVMSLYKGEEIGMEKHRDSTQFIRIEKGRALAIINGKKRFLKKNDIIMIPADTYHNVIALDNLKLYTIYSPPVH